MEIIYPFIAVCLAGFALLQSILGLTSYRRLEKRKFLLISIAFLFFFLKGIYALFSYYTSFEPLGTPTVPLLLIDLLIVILLYLSLLRS